MIVYCEDHGRSILTGTGLSAVPEAEVCGWLKDKFGVSWQIVPVILGELIERGDEEQAGRVVQAFLKMKKFDIEALKSAFEGR